VTFEPGSRLTAIGYDIFLQCEKLESIRIPASTESIGDLAFSDCEMLSSVTFESGSRISVVYKSAFEFCPLLERRFQPESTRIRCESCSSDCSAIVLDVLRNDFGCGMASKEVAEVAQSEGSDDGFLAGYRQALEDLSSASGDMGICYHCSARMALCPRRESLWLETIGFWGRHAAELNAWETDNDEPFVEVEIRGDGAFGNCA
jgi:hypothetical protein